jgi:protease IV
VVLRIDSPGGTVTGSDYIYHHLRKLAEEKKLPIVVSMGGICASGGYYIAMSEGDQKDAIFAEPTTWTGSIGVIIPHYDLSGLMKAMNVADDSIKSGPLKQMGAFTRPMTEAEKKALQGLVDDSFKRFKEIVKAGRPKFTDAALDKVATGEVFAADQAVANGLVDKIGFVEAAIDRAVELAKLDSKRTKVVKYKRPFALIDGLIASQAKSQPTDLQMLLDLAAPRAYYLSTWLPIIARSQ